MASMLTVTVSYVVLLALCQLCSNVDGYCYSHSGCSSGQYCCKNKDYRSLTFRRGYCKDSCVGLSCYYESDCATNETCCDSDSQCKSGDCDDNATAGWVFPVLSIVCAVVIISILGSIVKRRCKASRQPAPTRERVVVMQPKATGPTVIINQQQQQQQYNFNPGQPMYLQNNQPQKTLPGQPQMAPMN